MPLEARRVIRKMRGGAQAHLLEASDGHAYVVKFQNNPQHRRILVNEWIASNFLQYLGLATPQTAIVQISQQFLDQNPEVYIQNGGQRQAVALGWHFGSRYPGDPMRTTVYDFLPDTLLSQVTNLREFVGMLVFDKWMGNADSRQAIFFRARLSELGPAAPPERLGFVAQMVDNGYVFEGPHWRFGESPIQGLYFRPAVYHEVRGLESFEPWLERIRHFPDEVVDRAVNSVPRTWIAGEEDALQHLLEQLMRRRSRVGELIADCRSARIDPFPAWRH
ncbi:MAG: HipA family kinase [Acidobacteriota bacterium]